MSHVEGNMHDFTLQQSQLTETLAMALSDHSQKETQQPQQEEQQASVASGSGTAREEPQTQPLTRSTLQRFLPPAPDRQQLTKEWLLKVEMESIKQDHTYCLTQVAESGNSDSLVVEGSVAEDLVVKDPAVGSSAMEDPELNLPEVECPTGNSPVPEDPIVREPFVKDSAVHDSTVEDPLVTSKRGRGRPRKRVAVDDSVEEDPDVEGPSLVATTSDPKRSRGRPRKTPAPEPTTPSSKRGRGRPPGSRGAKVPSQQSTRESRKMKFDELKEYARFSKLSA